MRLGGSAAHHLGTHVLLSQTPNLPFSPDSLPVQPFSAYQTEQRERCHNRRKIPGSAGASGSKSHPSKLCQKQGVSGTENGRLFPLLETVQDTAQKVEVGKERRLEEDGGDGWIQERRREDENKETEFSFHGRPVPQETQYSIVGAHCPRVTYHHYGRRS